uniref:Glycosyltransferase RgtA/B/C/D-like domain-containing protein n=1 Tax=uncultured Armatimonadetes bacterium TaxID=157466 RepID=A0A6J4H7K2_9BACT|nr:hypothetical protein AVDCRST_MAG63-373 [uncultured Armatimonadetes bacterium]
MTRVGARDAIKSFFLDQPAAGSGARAGFPYAKAAAVGVLVFLLTFSRKPSSVLVPQFWAEDGAVFFAQAREIGLGSLLTPQAGYYNTFTRLAALFGNGVPVPFAPHYYLLVSVGVLLFIVGYLFSRRLHFRHPTLMALCLGLVPHDGEVFLTAQASNFYLGLALALFLVSDPPASRWQHVCDVVMIVLAGLTGPFSLIYLPLFVLRAARERGAPALKVRAFLVGTAGLLQLVQMHAVRLEAKEFGLDPREMLEILGTRLLTPLLTGPTGFLPTYRWLLGIYMVALLALLVQTFRRGRNHQALYLLAAGVSVVAATLYVFRGAPEDLLYIAAGDRFFFIPLVSVLWCLVQALETKDWVRPFAAVLISLCAVRTVGQPSSGFVVLEDLDWAEASRCIDGPAPCKVPINPRGWYIPYRPRDREPSPEAGHGVRSNPDTTDHVPEQQEEQQVRPVFRQSENEVGVQGRVKAGL